jgi:hypothetical protein
VRAGPFWLLDLWESFPSPVQRELVETLAEQPSFTAALKAVGFVEEEKPFVADEETDAIVGQLGGAA